MARPKKTKENKRTIRQTVNFTEEEYNKAKGKADKLNIGFTEYLRKSALKTQIKAPDKNYSNLAFQMAKIGSNLNQIVKKVHESKKLKKEDKTFFKDLYNKFEELKQNLEK